MTSTVLFSDSLVFTEPVGRRETGDRCFSDAVDHGYPDKLTIKGIKHIQVFSNKSSPDFDAVITGLKFKYDGVDGSICHGVVNVDCVGTLDILPHEKLVGVFGRLKAERGTENDGRIASIGFVVFNKDVGLARIEGPFPCNAQHQGASWETFGLIITLEGTTKDGIGITTLGFGKARDPDGVPGVPCESN